MVTTATSRPWHVWKNNRRLNSGAADEKVPESCCLKNNAGRASCNVGNRVDENLIHAADCFDEAFAFLDNHVKILTGLCIFFGVTLIIAAALAISLYYLTD